MNRSAHLVSIVIPTYQRENVLLATVQALLPCLNDAAAEILVIDQTAAHEQPTLDQLTNWSQQQRIQWIRRAEPSITAAMNDGLTRAKSPFVLFLDDDIEPLANLVTNHRQAHLLNPELWATVGQVIQPWQTAAAVNPPRKLMGLYTDLDFPYHSTIDHDVQNVMAGNLCVNRERVLSIGGFDENFIGSAFRFETEFARRVGKAGGQIRFLGGAGIRHLRVSEGGTRSRGSHLTSASPLHGQGDYYYAFLHGTPIDAWRYSLRRVVREVSTKFHATHPWWIPVKLVGEVRAMWAGYSMARTKREARSE